MAKPMPQTPPDYDTTRIIERPDGFYWQDKETIKEYGPFGTLMEAIADMQYNAEDDYGPAESLEEAEDEIGINGWIDPDTGLPGEEGVPRIKD